MGKMVKQPMKGTSYINNMKNIAINTMIYVSSCFHGKFLVSDTLIITRFLCNFSLAEEKLTFSYLCPNGYTRVLYVNLLNKRLMVEISFAFC